MAKSVLGDDPFASGSGPTKDGAPKRKRPGAPGKKRSNKSTPKSKSKPKSASTAATTAPGKRGAPKRAKSDRRPAPPTIDGAAARRAAQATATLGEPPPRVAPAASVGPGIDPESTLRPPSGSLVEELRHVEQHVTRRHVQEITPSRPKGPSFLDRVGQLLRPDTYRQILSTWMMRNRSDQVDDFGLDPVYAEQLRPLLEFLYHSYFRVEAVGMEHLPDHGRALIVANHSGTLPYDGAMIMYAVRFCHPAHRDVRPLVEDFVFHFPFLGVTLNRIGCVRACQENAERLLQGGRVVAVFPEGIKGIGKLYRDRYQLQRFGRGGFVKLALKTRSPIIPTAVVGAEEAHPMLARVTWLAKYVGIPYIPITPTFPWFGPFGALPVPSKWTIRFGEPLDLATQYGTEAQHDRILVNRLTEQVRSTIQAMVDETLSTRRSVVFG